MRETADRLHHPAAALFTLAFIDDDGDAQARELDRQRTPTEAPSGRRIWEARAAAFSGRVAAAHELFQRAVQESAARGQQRELGAQWQAEDAETHAIAGQCAGCRCREVPAALALSRDNLRWNAPAGARALRPDDGGQRPRR